jgi:predicted DNA-binding transcriptional regulator AlpA
MNVETREYLKSRQAGAKKEASESRESTSTKVLLLDASGAAELLGFTRQYLYELSSSGRLGPMPIYFGKRSRWSRYELINWVKAGCPNRQKWLLIKENVENTA